MKYKILSVLIVLSMFMVFTTARADTLKVGSQSSSVTTLQQLLTSKGYSLVADGNFGAKTETAVKNFQTASGLIPDGIVGPKTLTLLNGLQASSRACLPTTTPWIQVTSPNGGEIYTAGQQIIVTWTSCNITGNIAEINLNSIANGWSGTLIKDITNDGEETLNLPEASNFFATNTSFGQYFKIEIVAVNGTSIIKDSSDNLFTINSGGSFPVGCTSNVGYSSTTGLSCSGVTYPAGCTSSYGYSTTTGLACDGSQTFPVGCTSSVGYSSTTGLACDGSGGTNPYPAGCTSAVGYSSTTGLACDGSQTSISCNSTTSPWIQVLSPNGGETYTSGQQILISWKSCNVPTANIALYNMITGQGISLTLNGSIVNNNIGIIVSPSVLKTLPTASSWQSLGNPTPMSFGQYYKIQVYPGGNNLSGDYSDNLFTIN